MSGKEKEMTDNQITIYLDPIAYEKIIEDQKLFKTGKNKSDIIKKIIINHYSNYNHNINSLKQKIQDAITIESNVQDFNEISYQNIAWKITKYISETSFLDGESKRNRKKKIHIRKNKNDNELDFILDACPKNASESEYLANIIYSYLKEPQCEREKIIYKKVINKINDAIKNNQNIRIKTKSGKKIFISPKEICTSKERLYNYLLYQGYKEETNKYFASTIHIYNITSVYLDASVRTFQPGIEEQFKKMKLNGVQFSINNNTIYKVLLTDRGKDLFDSRYLERPIPLSKSDQKKGIYYFNCSELQFKSYFAPFLNEVIVLEPEEVRIKIIEEYKEVLNNYKNI